MSESGAELIAAERRRQVEGEGWTPEHDDSHKDGSLADAARAYLVHHDQGDVNPGGWLPLNWPWHRSDWKPDRDPIRNLVKAGALIAAEIDRLHRQAP